MSEQQSLIPIEVRTVDFYGDAIDSALVRINGETQVYIPLRSICIFLGLNWSGQYQRTLRDEVLRDKVQSVVVTQTNSRAGGDPEVLCIPLPYLPGWLFGVSPARVKPELRERITLYRRECYERLWDAFKHDILQSVALAPAPQPSGAEMAYETAMAVAAMAREQIQLEQRVNNAAQWAKGTTQWMKAMNARVNELEVRLSTDAEITNSQAAEVSLTVKTVANALEKRSTINPYGRVYGELYRKFGIASYKQMPQSRYDEVLMWLRSWYDEIVGDGIEK